MKHMYGSLRARLFTRLVPCADPACDCDGCMLWPGHVDPEGYGRIYADASGRLVHRVAWELEHGPVPDGLPLDHVKARGCRHRHCAKVAHLEPVTPRENLMRAGTFQARNAAKTHCDHGHEFTPENTYVWARNGWRQCRTCMRTGQRRRSERRRAQLSPA